MSSNRPEAPTITSLIAQRARAMPAALAILAPGRAPLPFGSLERQITDTAAALAVAGFGKGSRIAVALRDGPEAAVALLAVMSCAACVPLNPDSDEETLRDLCQRLGVGGIVVADDGPRMLRKIARDLGLSLLVIAHSAAEPAGVFSLRTESARPPAAPTAADPEDIGLVLHTSGTTGKPKAVPVTRRSQVESTLHRAQLLDLTERDRALCVTPLFSSAGLRRSLFPPLVVGGSIVCVSGFDADRLLDWLLEYAPTFYAATPAVHRAVQEAIDRRGCAPRHSLRFIVSSSAALATELQMRLEDALGVPVLQTYAMTEVSAITHDPLPPGLRRPGSAGLPEQGEVAIVGNDDRFLDAGKCGEIVVRSPQVFPGYENDPEANQQAFMGDWFRTGDLGHLDADGYLHVTGRANEMINRGGFKVAPAEVDAALMRHPSVIDAATFAVAHPTLGDDVFAAVVLRESPPVTLQQLRDFAFSGLAKFKVPTRIMAVAGIPKTALGKARRQGLADALGATARPAYVSPRAGHETIVARLFAEVLGVDAVGSADNFFSLGGDSLRAAQVITRANALLECALGAPALFHRPTVAEFAEEIGLGIRDGGGFAPPPIVALPRGR